jgi:hypothetical protein
MKVFLTPAVFKSDIVRIGLHGIDERIRVVLQFSYTFCTAWTQRFEFHFGAKKAPPRTQFIIAFRYSVSRRVRHSKREIDQAIMIEQRIKTK